MQMQTTTFSRQIPQKTAQLRTVNLPYLGPAVKSVSMLRNGKLEVARLSKSVERWFVTDLLEDASYTVTRHGEGYALSLASKGSLIVADVEDAADIPEVTHRLAQLIATS